MKKLVQMAAIAAVAGALTAAAPAWANCAADVAKAKQEASALTDANKKKVAMRHLAAAEKQLAAKNEKSCVSALGRAKKAMK